MQDLELGVEASGAKGESRLRSGSNQVILLVVHAV